MASTANRDEAIKCISISQRHLNANNFPSARRFAEKSLSLYPTPEAKQLLELITSRESDPIPEPPLSSGTAASASGAEAHPTQETTHHRHSTRPQASSSKAANGSASSSEKQREYTPEMAAVVKRIRKCKPTEYYEILGLTKSCEENDVKRAYKKLALQLHPDKNGAPGADEAFKMISKAFQVLSDPQKRAVFDQHGSDPDSRFSGMQSTSFANGGGPSPFGEELSPEDLFNMFFGGGGPAGFGGMGGGGFGGPTMFSATFGPGGFRTTRMGGAPRQQANQAQGERNQFLTLLPVLFIFFFPVLSSLFTTLFSTPPVPDPSYSYSQSSLYSSLRYTTPHKIPYYVNQKQFTKHPIWEALSPDARKAPQAGSVAHSAILKSFEKKIEERFAQSYWDQCQRGEQRKRNEIAAEQGFFGIGADWDKIRKIQERVVESCEILKQHGFLEG